MSSVGGALYVIVSGQAEVVREHPKGEQRLAVLGPGEHFGEVAVFQNVRRTATVRALGRVHLLALGRPAAISLSHTHPDFGAAIRRLPGATPTDGPPEL
jgi:CRP-like cAMP-binding protein